MKRVIEIILFIPVYIIKAFLVLYMGMVWLPVFAIKHRFKPSWFKDWRYAISSFTDEIYDL